MALRKKGRYNYSTLAKKYPSSRQERRIKVPGIEKRPIRFQIRSLVQRQFLRPPDWRFTLHVRGPKGRPWIGQNPLEMRATPVEQIGRGTLPERIIYKYLTEKLKFQEGPDFDFQSSLQGGRIDTGGIVADFLFENLRIVLNPLGPTHSEFIRIAKDREQIQALHAMGYEVYMIEEDDIYNESKFNEIMEKIFNKTASGGTQSLMFEDEAALEEISTLLQTIL